MPYPNCSASRLCFAVSVGLMCCGCDAPLSTLEPAGRDAERIARFFWWMAGGGAVVWLSVMAVALHAIRGTGNGRRTAELFVVGGGVVLPTLLLTVLLVFGLREVPSLYAQGRATGPRIDVFAEQWWWRVRYELPDGRRFELANEIGLRIGERISVRVHSADVVHSLWVPALAGKVDAIPGRTNAWHVEPTRTGVYPGVCAEYCGLAHAKMMLNAVVLEQNEYDAWISQQVEDAPARVLMTQGASAFSRNGCGACHTVRGSLADGVIGPDLTHVGARHGLGAGVVQNDVDGFRAWLTRTKDLKPGVHMPSFEMLAPADIDALALYLEMLK